MSEQKHDADKEEQAMQYQRDLATGITTTGEEYETSFYAPPWAEKLAGELLAFDGVGVEKPAPQPDDSQACRRAFEEWYKQYGNGDAFGFKLPIKGLCEIAWQAAWKSKPTQSVDEEN